MLVLSFIWLLKHLLPLSHWPELEASLRSRPRPGPDSSLHQQQLVWEQSESRPSACPLIGLHSPTRPLIGHRLHSINTVLRRLQSHLSCLGDDTWELGWSYKSRAITRVTWQAIWPGPVSVSKSILWSRQVFWKLKIVFSLILESLHHVLWESRWKT